MKNALFNTGSWSVHVLVAFLATPYIVYKLTDEVYGVYALLAGLIGFYGLLDLGLGQGVTKFVAQFNAENNPEKINRSINAALLVQISLGSLASALIFIFDDQILRFLNVPENFFNEAKTGLYIFAAGFLLQMITATFDATLQGLQRYDLTGKVNAAINVFLNVGIVVILFLEFGLKEVIAWTVFSTFLTLTTFYFIVRKQLPSWRFRLHVIYADFKMLFSFSGYVFISRISALFSNYIVRIVISYFLGPAAVTYYVVPNKIISMIGGFLGSIFRAIFPYASELGARGDKARIEKVFIEGSKYFAALSVPACLIIAVFAKPIMTVWMGAEFGETTWPVLMLIAATSAIGALSTVPTHVAIGLGYTRLRSQFSIISVLLYLIFLPLLTHLWGLYGAIASIFIAGNIPGIAFISFFTKRIMKISILRYFGNVTRFHLLPFFIAGLVMISGWNANVFASIWGVVLAGGVGILYVATMMAAGWLPLANTIWNLKNKNA